jgi:hypothetical protein
MISTTQPKMRITYDKMQLVVPYLRNILRIIDRTIEEYEMKVLNTPSKPEAQENSGLDGVSEELDENGTSVDGGSVFGDTSSQESSPSTITVSSSDQVTGDGEAQFTSTDVADILE